MNDTPESVDDGTLAWFAIHAGTFSDTALRIMLGHRDPRVVKVAQERLARREPAIPAKATP